MKVDEEGKQSEFDAGFALGAELGLLFGELLFLIRFTYTHHPLIFFLAFLIVLSSWHILESESHLPSATSQALLTRIPAFSLTRHGPSLHAMLSEIQGIVSMAESYASEREEEEELTDCVRRLRSIVDSSSLETRSSSSNQGKSRRSRKAIKLTFEDREEEET